MTAANEPSARIAGARARAEQRRMRQRARLRPVGWVAIAVVVIPALSSTPKPAATGSGLGVALALATFVACLVATLLADWQRWPLVGQLAVIVVAGAAGVALAVLQPHAPVELAPSLAVWLAAVRLPNRVGTAAAAAISLALAGAITVGGSHVGESVAAALLLCAVLAVSARLLRRANDDEDRAELLLAELEDARDAQAQAAVLAERGRIARELHDVLAHSLSALAIQLEGTRLLAEREAVSGRLAEALGRSTALAKDGMADARRAVGALRGDPAPAAGDLPGLVERFRELGLAVTFETRGAPRELSPEAGLTVYRAAQEALTNVARYAPGAETRVELAYHAGTAVLTVVDRVLAATGPTPALVGVGSGRGLAGMRERVEGVGGRATAEATREGFRVQVEVPA